MSARGRGEKVLSLPKSMALSDNPRKGSRCCLVEKLPSTGSLGELSAKLLYVPKRLLSWCNGGPLSRAEMIGGCGGGGPSPGENCCCDDCDVSPLIGGSGVVEPVVSPGGRLSPPKLADLSATSVPRNRGSVGLVDGGAGWPPALGAGGAAFDRL